MKALSSFSRERFGGVEHVLFWVGPGTYDVGPEQILLWRDDYRGYGDTGDIVRHRESIPRMEATPR